MMSQPASAITTILFTDLVNSTELLQRTGDEQAQRIFQAHHKLLREAVAANGGQEVKWLGDGLMVAFPSAADAVRCAIAMQQASSRGSAGERLDVRVGINVGEALQDGAAEAAAQAGDYFGTPVVVAKRLCDSAEAGQVICSSLVAGLLAGRQAFRFRDLGAIELKGFAEPVAACEAVYEREEPGAFLAHTPFVGRATETSRLHEKLALTKNRQGGLVMLVGEPGIGKTRTAEEFAEHARNQGAFVLWGRCYEGEWAPPYGPFAEAIAGYVRGADPESLRADLGYGGPAIARLVPALRDTLPTVEEPAQLQPDEERFRLLDAVAQFLIATSKRAPVVLVLDDLHWADKGTIAMLRHVARFARQERILIIGAYRDIELDRKHPLSEALAQLRREAEYERLLLKGLDTSEVSQLITTIGEQEASAPLVDAISRETDGNPFFIRETLLHLVDTGALYRKDGAWTSDATNIEELGIPEGVRQVIGRRLSRLSDSANRLLTAASAFNGGFRFQTVAAVASLDEDTALDAIDEALDAQIIRPAAPEHYDFTHALIRHTLYGEMNPSRQVRLHRTIADVMSERVKSYTPERQASHAAELAYQYHRSAALPGAERGVEYAIEAADQAEATAAWEEAAAYLRIALELLAEHDTRRPRLLGRLGIALGWALEFDDALAAASEAGGLIATAEGHDPAAEFLREALLVVGSAGGTQAAWSIAEQGLRYAVDRRDAVWASFKAVDLVRQAAADQDNPGIPLDTPEQREVSRIFAENPSEPRVGFIITPFASRAELMARRPDDPNLVLFYYGDYRRARPLHEGNARLAEKQGRLAMAAFSWANTSRSDNALGNFDDAKQAYQRAVACVARLPGISPQALQVTAARWELHYAAGEFEPMAIEVDPLVAQPAVETLWAFAAIRATAAAIYALVGRREEALRMLATVPSAIERAPLWAANYIVLPCISARALWELNRLDHVDVIERNLLAKVVKPDCRYPMHDSRLAMAQLRALQGHHEEASDWFQKARDVLNEQGARPLRAIVDYDEALMYTRRGAPGDKERAAAILDVALSQFREIGMPGWIRRAEELKARLYVDQQERQ